MTKQPWLKKRQSGVLAHLSSLPGDFGIGNLGADAHRFIDFLAESGFAYWQICPLGPTGYGDSPYQSFSTHAGNPYFLDLAELVAQGLLSDADLEPLRDLPATRTDYGQLYQRFWPILEKAADRYDPAALSGSARLAWHGFLTQNAHWLESYALFMALKKHQGGCAWTRWDARYRSSAALDSASLPASVHQDCQRHRIYQFWFFQQWDRLRDHARSRGIGVIGDIPIFVAHDSADVWSHPQVFRLHPDGGLQVSAGVPPDYFSEFGQYWGNPLYDWEYLKQTGYRWWLDRLEGVFSLCDIVRLDHFRAFANFWEIPGGAPDARSGRWVAGPGLDFFHAVERQFPQARIIAEDLGYIDEDVFQLRENTGLPGMKIIQFGFGHDANNVNLPHYYPANSVVYTGTHDNDSTRGWLGKLSGHEEAQVREYFRAGHDNSAWPFIMAAFLSVSKLAVITMQDLLDLDSTSRMNTPGTSEGNWQWRFTRAQLSELIASRLDQLLRWHHLSGRTGDDWQHDYSAPPEAEVAAAHPAHP